MVEMLKVLFLAAEAEPFVKVGGLGDVAGSLPGALRALSPRQAGGRQLDVRLVLPLHPDIQSKSMTLRPVARFTVPRRRGSLKAEAFAVHQEGALVYFISGEPLRMAASVYTPDLVQDREKYAFFSIAALELARQLDWRFDILHANDWHTALSAYALKAQRVDPFLAQARSILTLHNLPYMGGDGKDVLLAYGLEPASESSLPAWARSMPLPLGLSSADAIVAVSPGYAQEILTQEYGCGLEQFLRRRRESLHGILNGLDLDSFNPLTDTALAARFNADNLEHRSLNKTNLQKKLDLQVGVDIPLLAMVTRLDYQKGVDLALGALRRLVDLDWQVILLGSGDPMLEIEVRQLAGDYPNRVRIALRYDPGLSRLIYGGADIFLMPSRYEPCGLAQMIAMRYACLPLARATGGLKNTIRQGRTGFLFAEPTVDALARALRQALAVYANRERWQKMQRNAMKQDFSWLRSARQYASLYGSIVKEVVPGS